MTSLKKCPRRRILLIARVDPTMKKWGVNLGKK